MERQTDMWMSEFFIRAHWSQSASTTSWICATRSANFSDRSGLRYEWRLQCLVCEDRSGHARAIETLWDSLMGSRRSLGDGAQRMGMRGGGD